MRFSILCIAVVLTGLVRAQDFPERFIGHWEGELIWFQAGKKLPQKVNMQLIIGLSDTAGQYTWQLIYGRKNEDNRPYLLKAVDTSRGHWIIDERDGIILDHYWTGNRFTGAFTVQSTTILNSFWLEGDRLLVEFFSAGTTPVRKSGGASKEVPVVESYGIKSFQKALLRKRKS